MQGLWSYIPYLSNSPPDSLPITSLHGTYHFHRENSLSNKLDKANFSLPFFTPEVMSILQQYITTLSPSFLDPLNEPTELNDNTITTLFYLLLAAHQLTLHGLVISLTGFLLKKLPGIIAQISTEGKTPIPLLSPKKNSTTCQGCNVVFTLYTRAHHCRACKGIFCFYCCNAALPLAPKVEEMGTYFSSWKWWLSNLPYGTQNYSRVCKFCEEEVKAKYQHRHFIDAFCFLAPSLTLVEKCLSLPSEGSKWKWASSVAYNLVVSLSKKTILSSLSDTEKRWLWNNRSELGRKSSHLLLFSHHFISCSVHKEDKDEVIGKIMDQKHMLSHYEVLMWIKSRDAHLQEMAIQLLFEANDCMLDCYLPYLVYHLRHPLSLSQKEDKKYNTLENSLLWQFLLKRCLPSPYLREKLYLYLLHFSPQSRNFELGAHNLILGIGEKEGCNVAKELVNKIPEKVEINYGRIMCQVFNILLEQEDIHLYFGPPIATPCTTLCSSTLSIEEKEKSISVISNLYNYLAEHNGNKKIDDIHNVYIRSLAGYCLASYIIGIKVDPSLLKLTENGIFYYAGGYSLAGKSQIFLPLELIEVMGGKNSQNYHLFRSLIIKGYQTLRKYSHLCIEMYEVWTYLKEVNYTTYHNAVMERLGLEKSDEQAILDLNTKIEGNGGLF